MPSEQPSTLEARRRIVVAPAWEVFRQPLAGSNPPSKVILLVIVVIGAVRSYVPTAILMIVLEQAARLSASGRLVGSLFVPAAVEEPPGVT